MPTDSIELGDPGVLRAIIELAPVPLALVAPEGRLLMSNRAARALGVEADLGRILGALGVDPRVEVRTTDASGGARILRAEATALPDGSRLLAVRDETTASAERDELAQLRRVDSVGFVAAGVIHDFNNLLTPILCCGEMLERELQPGSRAREIATELRSAAERAASLSREILRMTRGTPARSSRLDVNRAITGMRGLIRLALPGDVELELTAGDAAADVDVDLEQLERAVLNLVANARDAMPRGGRLTVSAASCTLGEGMGEGPSGAEAYVSIAVTDTGIGMPAGVRERLFEQFFTTKSSGGGTGLGLASVHAFVRRYGGCVAVRSRTGEGTTVVMYFPRVAPARPPSMPVDAPPPGASAGSETILVVDREDTVRRAVRVVLEHFGYRVVEATDGERALVEIERREGRVDLVLADVVMLRMSGPALAERIERAGHHPAVLLMSGHSDGVIAQRTGARPGRPILRKAFTPRDLARSVRAALDARTRHVVGPS